jgi:hypothetical protein
MPNIPLLGYTQELRRGKMWKFIQNQTPPPLTRNLLGRGMALTFGRFPLCSQITGSHRNPPNQAL